jgi:hypothetical protein
MTEYDGRIIVGRGEASLDHTATMDVSSTTHATEEEKQA